MVDIHCHIVPGVDDGAQDRAMSLAMIEEARKLGITAIATTPHYYPGIDPDDTLPRHSANFDSIGNKSDVALMLSREVRVNSSLVDLPSYTELTYGGKGKYVLLELATQEFPVYLERLLFRLRLDGIVPIIAHPERNMALLREPKKVIELLSAGAHLQLTASAVSGHLGPTMEKFSKAMLDSRLVSFIASDAHNLTNRPFTDWAPALEKLSELELTGDEAQAITTDNPQKVLDSADMAPLEVSRDSEKSFLRMTTTGLGSPETKRKRFFFF